MFNSKGWVEGGVPGPKIKPSTQIALTSKVRGPLPPAKLIEEHPKPSMDRMTIFLIVFCRQMPVFFCTLPLLTIVTRVLCGCPDPIVGILLSGFFFKKAGGGGSDPKTYPSSTRSVQGKFEGVQPTWVLTKTECFMAE